RIDQGSPTAITAPVTLAECLVLPIRLGQSSVQQDFTDLIVRGQNVLFVLINDSTACQAADLRARYNLGLADALQIAAALSAASDAFLTNDVALKRVRELPILVLDELEL